MKIKFISGDIEFEDFYWNLYHAIDRSRFAVPFGFEQEHNSRSSWLYIKKPRLKEKKHYCGNHPGECIVPGTHANRTLLEGLDWVSLNTLVNDVCDRFNVVADIVQPKIVIIRKGAERRMEYGMHPFPQNPRFNVWDYDDDWFEDWRGKIAPDPEWPEGTPGIFSRDYYSEVK